MSKLLFLSGSTRTGSLNTKLAHAAAKIAESLGATTTIINLADYDMPIYNGDWEDANGLPDTTKALKKIFVEHDGFLIASPEYNSSYSSLLKNTIDWLSRPETKDEPMLSAFNGKTTALTAASPGALGGLRGLVPLRMLLGNINVHVIPKQFALGNATKAFNENGNLIDEKQNTMLTDTVKQFVEATKALKK